VPILLDVVAQSTVPSPKMPQIEINVQTRSKREMGTFVIDESTSVGAFKRMFARKNPRFYPSRQWFTIGEGDSQKRLTESEKLLVRDYQVKNGEVLVFKDLGKYISECECLVNVLGFRASDWMAHRLLD